ncbi:MAG: DMT family transporter [Spirosomaceae bacterium]|jgi:drug/metabolite transporter (DMT)-like permease|nr:DMT family transporter [Spirosomataceae bacterium]
MLITAFCFSVSGACTRVLGNHLSSVELVFFRNLIGVVFVLFTLIKKPIIQEGGKLNLLIFRGVIGTLALYLFFFAITKIGLAEAITYQQSYPIFLALFGVVFLKQKLNPAVWWGIVIGFSGVFLIFFPQFQTDFMSLKSHTLGLTNAILTMLAYMSIAQLAAYYDSRSIVLSFMISGIIMPIVSLGLGEFFYSENWSFVIAKYVHPRGFDWFWIGLLSVSALMGQIFLTKAFTYGKSAEVAAIGYSNILFSVFFGVLLGDPLPSLLSLFGILLIITSGILIAFKNK